MNNLDVELIAAMKALEYAKKKKLNHITLCHDYTGTDGNVKPLPVIDKEDIELLD